MIGRNRKKKRKKSWLGDGRAATQSAGMQDGGGGMVWAGGLGWVGLGRGGRGCIAVFIESC